jgi:hypothetical protein
MYQVAVETGANPMLVYKGAPELVATRVAVRAGCAASIAVSTALARLPDRCSGSVAIQYTPIAEPSSKV